ncbi:MAG: LysM peptidoglycan-binding domain-containing protein [candidate division KSB1 bacterium]|nr:LysM peptidoglycan-binding domain-containing protein [candidate division KSB1 bacterium]MDZ7334246.1 LysM peptidoglycan-binding domain-containing protein [candidate division KSB1 bacterium]MDZ7356356.1 LysM peptidoglycan-binding domain-containing protein [candidate division KSB1 bacterium]MDZ7375445.1 LysM peptidoglycan-binding domain-containing protein [candidate division KSB1 bacterium]MDZ7401048.1 LysM peptidoglycan-binding domain-containing protein [candidate division KSB1 bacterium]
MQKRSTPMSDLLLLPGQIRQEVTKMFRSVIRFSFLMLLLLIMFMLMLSAGWIQIVCNPSRINETMKGIKNGIQQPTAPNEQPNNEGVEQRSYRLEPHIVNPGETLFDLERKYQVNWKVLERINKVTDPLRLPVGTIIWIPVRVAES